MSNQFRLSLGLPRAKGFTIVELVVIIALLGILSSVAISRFGNVQTFQDLQLKDQLISVARIAQQTALNRYNQTVSLTVSRPDDWLFEVQVDGLTVKRQEVERSQSTLQALTYGDIEGATTAVITYDNLGNMASVAVGSNSLVDKNFYFVATDRIVCISLAGFAYQADSSNDCVNN